MSTNLRGNLFACLLCVVLLSACQIKNSSERCEEVMIYQILLEFSEGKGKEMGLVLYGMGLGSSGVTTRLKLEYFVDRDLEEEEGENFLNRVVDALLTFLNTKEQLRPLGREEIELGITFRGEISHGGGRRYCSS